MKRPEDFGITKYKWVDGKLDVYQDVILFMRGLIELPFDFGIIYGDFDCSFNKLKTLKGCPKEILGSFNCSNNLLKTLEYCSDKIIGNSLCFDNELISLKGCPLKIGGNFDCSNNKLVSLEYCPNEINGNFSFEKNNIKKIKHFPKVLGKIDSRPLQINDINKMIKLESNKDLIRSKMNIL